jgi:hypothetical protein
MTMTVLPALQVVNVMMQMSVQQISVLGVYALILQFLDVVHLQVNVMTAMSVQMMFVQEIPVHILQYLDVVLLLPNVEAIRFVPIMFAFQVELETYIMLQQTEVIVILEQ